MSRDDVATLTTVAVRSNAARTPASIAASSSATSRDAGTAEGAAGGVDRPSTHPWDSPTPKRNPAATTAATNAALRSVADRSRNRRLAMAGGVLRGCCAYDIRDRGERAETAAQFLLEDLDGPRQLRRPHLLELLLDGAVRLAVEPQAHRIFSGADQLVGPKSLPVNVPTGWGKVLGGSDRRSRSHREVDNRLNNAFPEGPDTDQRCDPMILQRAGDDLRSAGGELIHQDNHGQLNFDASRGAFRLLAAIAVNGVDERLTCRDEPIGHPQRNVQQPAAVTAQVQDQRPRSRLRRTLKEPPERELCVLVERDQFDIGDAGIVQPGPGRLIEGPRSLPGHDLNAVADDRHRHRLTTAQNDEVDGAPLRTADADNRLLQRHSIRGGAVNLRDAVTRAQAGAGRRRTGNGLHHDEMLILEIDEDADTEEEPLRILFELIERTGIHEARILIAQRVQHALGRAEVQPLRIRPRRGAALGCLIDERGDALSPIGRRRGGAGAGPPRTSPAGGVPPPPSRPPRDFPFLSP